MKVVNSSSTLLHIMIPQFQQLLPLETNISGSWQNPSCSPEKVSTINKFLSPPMSTTPSSICTDLSDSEHHPIDLSSTARKYSISTPPLSNIKSESIDFVDGASLQLKQGSTMFISNNENNHLQQSKTIKKSSNFTIEHLLSTKFRSPTTFNYLMMPNKQVHSVFTKKKIKHFSDNYLHQIIYRRKQKRSSFQIRYSTTPRGIFVSYIFDLVKDFINQHNQIKCQEKFLTIDALEQLAEIACKIDTRQSRSVFNEDKLTSKIYHNLLKQCHSLIKQIYHKNHHKTYRKRLYYRSNVGIKRHLIHFARLLQNVLQTKTNFVLDKNDHSDCQVLTTSSDNENRSKEKLCSYLKVDQIVNNFEILLPNNGLVYEGIIQLIADYDDLLLIRLNHERQTYLIPTVDLCRLACPKMIPNNFNVLRKNLRVCALWSTSLRGLHPALIKNLPSDDDQFSMISLLFDDGDTGLIKLEEIRLLPDNFIIQGIDLEEWRVSSFQIPSLLSTSQTKSRRKSSSLPTNYSNNSLKKSKEIKTSLSMIKPPQWTLNVRSSTISCSDTNETLRKGDCIILHGTNQSLSYIGKVLKFYRDRVTQQELVRLKWYYSPRETPIGCHKNDLVGALYESTHIDVNPIATIRYKGTIYPSYDDYVNATDYGKQRKETDFYLVGNYDPVSGELQRYDNQFNA